MITLVNRSLVSFINRQQFNDIVCQDFEEVIQPLLFDTPGRYCHDSLALHRGDRKELVTEKEMVTVAELKRESN
jgi:hypothetical protein